jgi:hypothetical protein
MPDYEQLWLNLYATAESRGMEETTELMREMDPSVLTALWGEDEEL